MNTGSKLIFFDTETTGNTQNDFLVQIAYKDGADTFTGLYKPAIRIPAEASAVHHITNKMVADLPAFRDTEDAKKIKELLENENSIIVAHNAPFDLAVIKKEDIEPKRFICTLRLARYLDKEEKIDRYNLQYLRYLLEIEVDATAHSALGDVLVLEKLFEKLKSKMIKEATKEDSRNLFDGMKQNSNKTESEIIKKMIEISSHPSLLHTFKFGKHNGKRIEEVVKIDKGYLEWLLNQKLNGDTEDEDWIYTLKHFLKKK